MLSAILLSQSSTFLSSVLFPPASPAPEGLLGPTLQLLSIALFNSLITQIPPKPPHGHLTLPLLFGKPSPAYSMIADFIMFSLQVETSTHLNQMGALWSPVKRATAAPHSSSHRWMFFQSLPSAPRGTSGLNLEKRVNFLPQLARPSQVQPHLLKF